MTEPSPTPEPDGKPFDLSSAEIHDTPVIPDFKASREPLGARRRLFSGDRRDTPPRTTRTKTPPKRTLPSAASKPGYFVEPLTQAYVFLGMGLMPVDPICANAIVQAGPNCAEALDQLAQKNETIRRTLYALLETSAVGMVIAAHTPILVAVMMHHVPAVQRAMGSVGQEMAENIEKSMRQQRGKENPE